MKHLISFIFSFVIFCVCFGQELPDTVVLSNIANTYSKYNYAADKTIYDDASLYEWMPGLDRLVLWRLLRNDIIAHHGHIFQDWKLRYFFDKMPWYKEAIIETPINDIEKQNSGKLYEKEIAYWSKPPKRPLYSGIIFNGEKHYIRPVISLNNPEIVMYKDSSGYHGALLEPDYCWHCLNVDRNNGNEHWTVGNLSSLGMDEIIAWQGCKLYRIDPSDGIAYTNEFELKDTIRQVIIGDITNDGKNEIVIVYDNPDNKSAYSNIMVGTINLKDMSILWDDTTGQLKFVKDWDVPGDRLCSIGDFDVDGINRLYVSCSQSDVSPTRYYSLIWHNHSLIRSHNSFFISQSGKTESDKENKLYLTGGIKLYNGINKALIGTFIAMKDSEGIYKANYKNGTITDMHLVVRDWLSTTAICMDPDGKGQGIMCFTNCYDNTVKYSFYR